MPPIDDDLLRFLESGLAVLVATRDHALHPFVTRGWGVRVHDDDRARISLCVHRAGSARTLADLAANARVAVSLGDQATFRAVQIKGRAVAIEDADAGALARAAEHFTRFAEGAAKLGVPPHLAQALFTTDLSSITLVAEELFDQTPGRAAGRKLA